MKTSTVCRLAIAINLFSLAACGRFLAKAIELGDSQMVLIALPWPALCAMAIGMNVKPARLWESAHNREHYDDGGWSI